jgi:hypothetical protein
MVSTAKREGWKGIKERRTSRVDRGRWIPSAVLKTPASILSRDGNGAGAPEKDFSNAFAGRKRMPAQ